MKHKSLFFILIILILGATVLGIVAQNKVLDAAAKNKKFIDHHAKEIDETFVYQYEEKLSETQKAFYYKSEKYPNFTLIIKSDISGDGIKISDNFSLFKTFENINLYFKDFFGENTPFIISNISELNALPTIDEALSYNNFDITIGILDDEHAEDKINTYKEALLEKEINCNIYFYYLTSEQFTDFSKELKIEENNFVNYRMFILKNGKVETEIKYK